MGELCTKVKSATRRMLYPAAFLLAVESAYLWFQGRSGAEAFFLISLGTCLVVGVWSVGAIGLPLLPLVAVQALVIYGLPIAVGHDVLNDYRPAYILKAGEELLIFDLAMVLSWGFFMRAIHPSPPISYALDELKLEDSNAWKRMGFALVIASTGYATLDAFNYAGPLVSLLPSGSSSIFAALVAIASMIGFFLVSLALGTGKTSAFGKLAFWCLLILNAMIASKDFLLSSAASSLIAVAVGFFWSNGRMPVIYLTVTLLSLSFLNTGKTTMRERYWSNDPEPMTAVTARSLPDIYLEWIEASYYAVIENESASPERDTSGGGAAQHKNQTLLDRVDNLQNLLFVIDAEDSGHIEPLHGATYSVIPALLVPRILVPNKPRSHEGQVILNVHFGRQDLYSTFTTYIAWGLLPEAYGNFGPVAGSVIIGAFLGGLFAWIENLTARKLFISVEGFLALCLLLHFLNSSEMVASVLVTAIFQSLIVIAAASIPFARRTVAPRHPERMS